MRVPPQVLKLEVVAQAVSEGLSQGMVERVAEGVDDSSLVTLHVLKPDDCHVPVVPLLPASSEVVPITSIDMETILKPWLNILQSRSRAQSNFFPTLINK